MTPDQLRAVLQEVTQANLPTWYIYAVFLLMGLVGSWFGAYLGEKGKRYATSEDAAAILQEVRKTTEATKQIEARIAGGLWLEQRRWDQRRDVYWDVLKSLVDVFWTCAEAEYTLKAAQAATGAFEEAAVRASKANEKLKAAASASEEVRAEIVSDAEKALAAIRASEEAKARANSAAEKASEGFNASMRQLANVTGVSWVILPDEAVAALNNVLEGVQEAGIALRQNIDRARRVVVEVAREDLGLPLAQFSDKRAER